MNGLVTGGDNFISSGSGYHRAPQPMSRPLKQPQYDAEFLPAGRPLSEINFFRSAIGYSFEHKYTETKQIEDTNLQQPGQLCMPLEFSLFGFNFNVQHGIAVENLQKIYFRASFQYITCGNRPLLTVPLNMIYERRFSLPALLERERTVSFPQTDEDVREHIPRHPIPVDFPDEPDAPEEPQIEETALRDAQGNLQAIETSKERQQRAQEYYNFTVGRSALRIRHGQNFGIKVRWARPIVLTEEVYVQAIMNGITWYPLN